MRKAFKFRIFPSKANITKLNRTRTGITYAGSCIIVRLLIRLISIRSIRNPTPDGTWVVKHKPELPELSLLVYS